MKSLGPLPLLLLLSCLLASSSASAAGEASAYRLELSPASIAPEKAQTLTLRILDAKKRAVTKFDSPKDPVRLFLVRGDIGSLEELTPKPRGKGRFSAPWVAPKEPGGYVAWALFDRDGSQIAAAPLKVTGEPGEPFDPETDVGTSRTNGRELLVLRSDVTGGKSGGIKTLIFDVRQAGTGAALTDFEPVQGARAHLFAVKVGAADRVFVHARAHEPDDGHEHADGANPHAGPTEQARYRPHAQSAGAQLDFEVQFPEPGLYRVWIQYARKGRVELQAFTLPVQ